MEGLKASEAKTEPEFELQGAEATFAAVFGCPHCGAQTANNNPQLMMALQQGHHLEMRCTRPECGNRFALRLHRPDAPRIVTARTMSRQQMRAIARDQQKQDRSQQRVAKIIVPRR